MSVKPILQDIREVGKTIASSKKLFMWKFSMDGKDYTVELYNSVLSGKKKITLNGQVHYENNSYQGAFHYNFTVGRNSLSLVQHGDRFELRINNQPFSHLYDQRMNKSHFQTDSNGGGMQMKQGKNISFNETKPNTFNTQPSKSHQSKKPEGPSKEEEEIQRAIELSMRTADEEERKRLQREKESAQNVPASSSAQNGGFDFGGMHKQENNGNLNDFDFGNFTGSQPPKAEEPKPVEDIMPSEPLKSEDPGNLLDFMNAPSNPAPEKPSAPSGGDGGFDFLNSVPASQPAAAATAASASNDPFSFNVPSQPVQPAQPEQPAQQENKGFVPQLFNQSNQMMAGGMNGGMNQMGLMGQQQQQFQTSYTPMAAQQSNNPFGTSMGAGGQVAGQMAGQGNQFFTAQQPNNQMWTQQQQQPVADQQQQWNQQQQWDQQQTQQQQPWDQQQNSQQAQWDQQQTTQYGTAQQQYSQQPAQQQYGEFNGLNPLGGNDSQATGASNYNYQQQQQQPYSGAAVQNNSTPFDLFN